MASSNRIPGSSALLLDEKSDEWSENNVPLRDRGVRLSWLCAFVESLWNTPYLAAHHLRLKDYERAVAQQRAALVGPWDNVPWVDVSEIPNLVELTTRRFVAEHVIPLTASVGAPLYARVPLSERGRPDVFLSHAWDAVILSLHGAGRRGTLDAFGPGVAGIKEEFVWIDFVCYNQHRLTEESIAFDMEAIVKSIGKVAFAVTPVPLFDRMWCLWELLSVSRNDCDTQFCVAPGYRTDKRAIVNDFEKSFTSVRSARATKAEDYEKLLSAIVDHFGSTRLADDYIRNLMNAGMANPWFELDPEEQ